MMSEYKYNISSNIIYIYILNKCITLSSDQNHFNKIIMICYCFRMSYCSEGIIQMFTLSDYLLFLFISLRAIF